MATRLMFKRTDQQRRVPSVDDINPFERINELIGREETHYDFEDEGEECLDFEADADADIQSDEVWASHVIGALSRNYGFGNSFIADGNSIVKNLSVLDKTLKSILDGGLSVPSLAMVGGDATQSFLVGDPTGSSHAVTLQKLEAEIEELKANLDRGGTANDEGWTNVLRRISDVSFEFLYGFKDNIFQPLSTGPQMFLLDKTTTSGSFIFCGKQITTLQYGIVKEWTLNGDIRSVGIHPTSDRMHFIAASTLYYYDGNNQPTAVAGVTANTTSPAHFSLIGDRLFIHGNLMSTYYTLDGTNWIELSDPNTASASIIAGNGAGQLRWKKSASGDALYYSDDWGTTTASTTITSICNRAPYYNITYLDDQDAYYVSTASSTYTLLTSDAGVPTVRPGFKYSDFNFDILYRQTNLSSALHAEVQWIKGGRSNIWYYFSNTIVCILDFNRADQVHGEQKYIAMNPYYNTVRFATQNRTTYQSHKPFYDEKQRRFIHMGATVHPASTLCYTKEL